MGTSSKDLPRVVACRSVWLAALILAVAAPAAVSDGWVDLLLTPDATTVIDQPGNYRVVADVTMTSDSLDCIQIAADDVTLDLDGHTLNGVSMSTGTGIAIHQTSGQRAVIRNGTIRRFAGGGVVAWDFAHVHGLRLLELGGVGIWANNATWIEGNWFYGATAAIQIFGNGNLVKGNQTTYGQNGYSLELGDDITAAISNTIVDNIFMSYGTWIDSGIAKSIYIHGGSEGNFNRNIASMYYFHDGTTTIDVHQTVGPGVFRGSLKWFNDDAACAPADNVWYE